MTETRKELQETTEMIKDLREGTEKEVRETTETITEIGEGTEKTKQTRDRTETIKRNIKRPNSKEG